MDGKTLESCMGQARSGGDFSVIPRGVWGPVERTGRRQKVQGVQGPAESTLGLRSDSEITAGYWKYESKFRDHSRAHIIGLEWFRPFISMCLN